jgi:cysteine desulfurase / selenocysteine lyase
VAKCDFVEGSIMAQSLLRMPNPQTMVDPSLWRQDFPILVKGNFEKNFVYLDTASSAQKPLCVLEAIQDSYQTHYANIHRGLYEYSQRQTEAYEAVRIKIKDFTNAPSAEGVVFTRNTTEAINLFAQTWGREHLKVGDEIIISEMEHHANIVPWQLLQEKNKFVLHVARITDQGMLDLDHLKSLLSTKTKLVSLVHISNVLGTINPIDDIKALMRRFAPQAKLMLDGSQSVVHQPIDIQQLGCDVFVFTGHKLYGPTGVGVLIAHPDFMNEWPPYQGGGDMIDDVDFAGTTYRSAPARFEAGTPAFCEVIALGAAIDYLSSLGWSQIMAHEKKLMERFLESLLAIQGLRLLGSTTPEGRTGVFSFTLDKMHPSDVGMILDQMGVAVRTGHHCCMPLMKRFDLHPVGTIRASLGLYSNEEDINQFMAGLKKAKELLS